MPAKLHAAMCLGIICAMIAFRSDAQQEREPELKLIVDLEDGSRIVGSTPLDGLPVLSPVLGAVTVPLMRISSVEFSATNGTAMVRLRQGDQLQGKIDLTGFDMETAFGKVRLTVATIRQLRVQTIGAEGYQAGLILHLNFNQDDADQFEDQSGNGHHAINHQIKIVAGGVNGSAGRFDGKGYLKIARTDALEPEKITVTAWVKSPGFRPPGFYVISKGADECKGASYAFGSWPNTPLRFYINGRQAGANHSSTAPETVWNDQWHHLAGIFDGRSIRLYLDGKLVGAEVRNDGPIEYDLPTDNDLYVGNYIGCQNPFIGLMDEAKIYDRPLTAEEIADAASEFQ